MGSKKKKELVKVLSQLADSLSQQEKEAALKEALQALTSSLTKEEKAQTLKQTITEDEKQIPVSIFTTNLSGLEALVLYLKDTRKKSISEIATILNRTPSTIYTTYTNAKSKKRTKPSVTSLTAQLEIFSDRQFSVLESLVFYLRHEKGLSLTTIAVLLNRSYSTVKTAHRRCQTKRKT